jgi:hypothetical protein
MGLDMYLYAERYVSGYNFQAGSDTSKLYDKALDLFGMERNEDSPHLEVKFCVGYWRKANAIHNWFVQNVQDGIDECQTSYVEREQLESLRMVADRARNAYELGDSDLAGRILPPTSGFFLGGTAVDDWYADSLTRTIEIIDKALKLDDCSFYYHSSW